MIGRLHAGFLPQLLRIQAFRPARHPRAIHHAVRGQFLLVELFADRLGEHQRGQARREFLEDGPGPYQKDEWANYGLDLGESSTYVTPPVTGAKIRVTSTDGDDTGVIKIFGLDSNGVAQSASLTLPDATSSVYWARVSQVIKPKTAGDVVLTFIDRYGQQVVGADYRSIDINPTFRCYRFTAIADDQTKMVDAIVRRRLFDIAADTDELFVTNLNALRLAVKAVSLLDKGDLQMSEAAFAASAQILRDEAQKYRNHHPTPVNVTKIGAMSERGDIY